MKTPELTLQMAHVLQGIRRANRPPFRALTVPEAREAYTFASEVLELPRAPLARVEDFRMPMVDGVSLPARLYSASGSKLPVVLYLHGGGFTIGNLDTHDSLCRQIALRSGAAVVATEYRLVPEYRFPMAVSDRWAALRWLAHEGAKRLRLDASRLAVAGDSSGGTLAAVCAILAEQAGMVLRHQVLITPGTAPHAGSNSHRQFASGYLLEAAGIDWFFNHYIDKAVRADRRFAPLNAPSLEDLAPACAILAGCIRLADEGLAYADRLRLAGVPAQLEFHRGLTHDFIKMGRAIPEAISAQVVIASALSEAFRS